MDVEEEEEGSRGASSVPVSSHGEDDDIEEEYFHPWPSHMKKVLHHLVVE